MVRIEDKKIVIEVPTTSRVSGCEEWEEMTAALLHLVQTADGDLFDSDERYIILELLCAMLPKFECCSCGSAVSEL